MMNCKISNLIGCPSRSSYFHKCHSRYNQQSISFSLFDAWKIIVTEVKQEFPVLAKSVDKLKTFQTGLKLAATFFGKECSPIVAQRAVRGYRIFQLHSRLWSYKFPGSVSKKALLSSVIFSLCQSNNSLHKTIKDTELSEHIKDLEFIHELTAATVVCSNCKDRLVVDKKVKGVKYCHCPDSPQSVYSRKIDGYSWVPFIETADLIVWRQPHPSVPGMHVYKVYGYYDDISAEDFLNVQLDIEYRKQWDDTALQLKVVESDSSSNSEIIYWEMKWPRMFANRDYVFARRHTVDGNKDMVIMSRAVAHPLVPERKGIHRVTEYSSVMHIRSARGLSEPGVEFGLTYYDNPGLSLPQWLTNWAAMTGIPDFLDKQRNAARAKRYGMHFRHRIAVSSSHSHFSDNDKHDASTDPSSASAPLCSYSKNPKAANNNKVNLYHSEDSKTASTVSCQLNQNIDLVGHPVSNCTHRTTKNNRLETANSFTDENSVSSISDNNGSNNVPVSNSSGLSQEQQKNELLSQFFKKHVLQVQS